MTLKSDQDPHIEKSWIRIRICIETNADPQHWCKVIVRIRTNFYQEIFPKVKKVKTYVADPDPVNP